MKLSFKRISTLDLKPALLAAQAEPSPRARCQALSWVARYVRDQKHVATTAKAAAEAAAQEEDLFRAVFVLAWPIRAMLERDEEKLASKLLTDAITKSNSVTPASSKSEALFLLMQASMFGGDRFWEAPFKALIAASLPAEHWRQRRNIRDAICIAASLDYGFAKQAAQDLPDEKLKATVLDRLGYGKKQPPRPFFW